MSTNFYVNTLGTSTVKCPMCDRTMEDQPMQLHLGLRASGWPFTFQAMSDDTLDTAYDNWTQRAKSGQIVDEYGTQYSFTEMLDVIARCGTMKIHKLYAGQFIDDAGRVWDTSDFS